MCVCDVLSTLSIPSTPWAVRVKAGSGEQQQQQPLSRKEQREEVLNAELGLCKPT